VDAAAAQDGVSGEPTVVIPAAVPNPLRGAQDQSDPPESSSRNDPSVAPLDQQAFPAPGSVSAAPASDDSSAGAPPEAFGLQADAYPQPSEIAAPVQPNQADPRDQVAAGYARPPQPAQGPPSAFGYDNQAAQPPNQPAASPYAASPGSAAPNRFEGESSGAPLADYYGTTSASSSSSTGGASSSYGNSSAASSNPYGSVVAARASTGPSSDEGTGRPSTDRNLDGQQSPQLSIQKIAPEEIQVGKPAVFRVEVKNTGPVAAGNVEIRDQIPEGTRLIDTKPAATRGTGGELVWSLGKLDPGGSTSVEMQLMPTAEGEIGSVATVHFGASASARTRATRPQLVVNVASPTTVLIEGEMALSITISNPGTGVASKVVLEGHIPACLQHPAGTELEYEVGDLAPNESKTLELKLTAVRAGRASNLLVARADAVPEVKKEMPIEVVAPQLQVALSGPKSRYLERQATYELSVSNPGTAPARGVRLTAELPSGLKFVSANHNAHYDPQTRIVQWALAELPTGETGTVQLTTLPVEIGRHAVRLQSTAEKAPAVQQAEEILVDGIAAIRFEVRDVQDPIEVGGETVYEVRVLNQGSKEATQVCLAADISPGLQVIAAEGPDGLGNRMQGGRLVFDPLARLAPKADVTYRIRVQGRQPGDQRLRVQLTAAELQSPVTKEESTNVFSDQ
ncbi:MAG TPA: hypothetical protein VJL29_06550, partial [Thermoguttaceae bacterium]|nr:hypothetical protein [Thermoguttaceae bacterium]